MEADSQNTVQRSLYQIPTRLQVEDKIITVGGLGFTMRQTGILVIGGCLALDIWRLLAMLPPGSDISCSRRFTNGVICERGKGILIGAKRNQPIRKGNMHGPGHSCCLQMKVKSYDASFSIHIQAASEYSSKLCPSTRSP